MHVVEVLPYSRRHEESAPRLLRSAKAGAAQIVVSEWIHGWKRNGWKTADRKPVKNADLWQELDALSRQHQLEWIWVKGHAGHPENERADALANRGIDELEETG